MNTQYVATRIINDVMPVMKKKGYKKYIDPHVFIEGCRMFFEKKITNLQFKEFINVALETANS